MNSKADHVRAFFNNVDGYLKNGYQIAIRTQQVRELLGDPAGLRIIDLGCGDGSISRPFAPNNRVTLVDASENMLAAARLKTPTELSPNVRFILSDVTELALEEVFDVVMCIGVIAHVDDVQRLIRKLSSLAKPGGRCLLQITDSSAVLGKLESFYANLRNAYRTNDTPLRAILEMCRNEGLTYVESRSTWPALPGMGRLPDAWRYRYVRYTAKNALLKRFGSEVILLFVKQG